MIASTNPKPSRFKYAAMVLGAAAVAAAPLASPAIAAAQKYWDIEYFDHCMESGRANYQRGEITLQELDAYLKVCCAYSDGVWNAATQDCQAPPGDTPGSRQLPGNVQIPSDIATAPVTKAPPRPIQVPSDIAIATAESQAPA